jgi:hypothetical protein
MFSRLFGLKDGLPGSQGPQGPPGLKGDNGLQGSAGQGYPGPPGQGQPGQPGLLGPVGPVGPQGLLGLPGPAGGPPGPQGPQGQQGLQGYRGDIGLTGDKGTKGDRGDSGPQGVKGDKGDKGDQGIQGIQGIKGDKGEQGLKGEIPLQIRYSTTGDLIIANGNKNKWGPDVLTALPQNQTTSDINFVSSSNMNFMFQDPTFTNKTSCIKMGNLYIPDRGGMNNAFIGHCNNNIDNLKTREDFEKLSGIVFDNDNKGVFLTGNNLNLNGMSISKNGNLQLVSNGTIKIGGTEINEDDLKKLLDYTRN